MHIHNIHIILIEKSAISGEILPSQKKSYINVKKQTKTYYKMITFQSELCKVRLETF